MKWPEYGSQQKLVMILIMILLCFTAIPVLSICIQTKIVTYWLTNLHEVLANSLQVASLWGHCQNYCYIQLALNWDHHVYSSLESTVSKMSVEIMVKCKNDLLLKMGTPPNLSLHNVVGHKHGKCDTPLVLSVPT